MHRNVRTPRLLGAAVRALRHERELTQEQLAAASGISRRWIIDLEAGKGDNASLGLTLALLEVLGASITLETDAP